MRTWNNNFMRETKDKQGRTIYKGYGIESIEDFAYNVQAIKSGATLESLAGTYPERRGRAGSDQDRRRGARERGRRARWSSCSRVSADRIRPTIQIEQEYHRHI